MTNAKNITKIIVGEDLYYLKDTEVRGDLNNHASNTDIHVTAAEKEYWNSKVNPPSYSAPTAKQLTYTGEAQDLLNPGSSTSGSIQYSTDEVSWSTTIPQGTNAGTYTVYWKFAGSEIVYVDSTAINVTIAKATPTYTAPTAKSGLVYNATAQELLNAGSTSDGTISYSEDGENWSSSIPLKTNADSYTVYWKLTGDANHNDIASTAISVSIAKVTPTVTAPTAKSLTYNEQAQGLVNAGSTDFGMLQYSLDNESYSGGTPYGTNAGNYTVYYKVVGDSNVNGTNAQSISCSIAKVTPTYTAPTAKTGLDNPSSPVELVNAGSTNYGMMQYSLDNSNWSTSIPTAMNVGTYTVYWRIVGNSNINDVAGTGVSVTITSDWVDLGLPSGRKWAKGNIVQKEGGGYKIGEPTDSGAYFSWGNIDPHFSSNGSTFDDGYMFDQRYYNDNTPGSALTADIASNDAAHDAALACLGGSARLPTKEECQELIDNTDKEWTAIGGVNGVKFMKKSDHSVYVFLPAVGYFTVDKFVGRDQVAYFWSSTYSSAISAHSMLAGFTEDQGLVTRDWAPYSWRHVGCSVRAVK